MIDGGAVFLKIAGVFVVLSAGWVARRRGILTDAAVRGAGRFTIDIALPCLIYTRMLATVTREALAAEWTVPLAGVAVAAAGEAAGRLARRGAPPESRTAFVLCVAYPNWFYLPLAVLGPILGDDAVRTLLLANIGVHGYLWTAGLLPFTRQALPEGAGPRAGGRLRHIGRGLRRLANPALLATAAGVATVILHPPAESWGRHTAAMLAAAPWPTAAAATLVEALAMLGAVAVPLNLALVGAQLGQLPPGRPGRRRLLARVVAWRLVVAPTAMAAMLWAAARLGWPIGDVAWVTLALMAAMPVAVVCSLITEVYGGDTGLAARAIFWTTLLSLATIPAWAAAAPALLAWAR